MELDKFTTIRIHVESFFAASWLVLKLIFIWCIFGWDQAKDDLSKIEVAINKEKAHLLKRKRDLLKKQEELRKKKEREHIVYTYDGRNQNDDTTT